MFNILKNENYTFSKYKLQKILMATIGICKKYIYIDSEYFMPKYWKLKKPFEIGAQHKLRYGPFYKFDFKCCVGIMRTIKEIVNLVNQKYL